MTRKGSMAVCYYDRMDCFAYMCGFCTVCTDTAFNKKTCPFFKTKMTRSKEHHEAVQRLMDIGRDDLIEKYGRSDNAQKRLWRSI